MLTSDEIQAAYDELGKMYVKLDASPERGLGYIRDRLTLARAMQDRVGELRLKASIALTKVQEAQLVAQQLQLVDPSKETKAKIAELEVQKQRHAMLVKMIAVQAQLLSRTAMDIRLLKDLTTEQIKRGEIDPNESPGLVQPVSPADIAAGAGTGTLGPPPITTEELIEGMNKMFPELTEPAGPDSFGGTDFPEPKAAEAIQTISGAQLTSFDAPTPVPDDDRVKLADTQATPIDALFEEMTHGSPAPGGPF